MGDSSDKNDKTQLLSDSQVVEVKPAPPKTPKPSVDKNDRSVWKGVVVGADDFAPPAQSKSAGPSSIVLVILALAVLGGGGYLAWTKLRSQPAAAVPDAAKAAVIDAMPQDAAPVAVPSATPDAVIATPDAEPIDAGIEDAGVTPDAGVDAGVKPIRRKYRPKRLLEQKTAH